MIFVTQAAAAVTAALDASGTKGRVAVVGQPRLGRAVAGAGREVLFLSPKLRSLKRTHGISVCGVGERLPIADGSLAALVGVGASQDDGWEELLGEWSRAVAAGGVVVMVDRASAVEATRRALCVGLTSLEQRAAGRTIVTSGTVTRY